MEYQDEKIAEELNKGKKGVSGNIYDGVYIKEELYTFSEKRLFDDTFSVMIPDQFGLMDEETKKMKFLAEQKPQVVYTNMDMTVTFGFSNLINYLPSKQVPATARQVKTMVRRAQPANIFYDKKDVHKKEIDYSWFDFKGYALDGQIYTMNAIMSINSKMFLFTFISEFRKMDLWKPILLQVMDSMKDLTRLDDNPDESNED